MEDYYAGECKYNRTDPNYPKTLSNFKSINNPIILIVSVVGVLMCGQLQGKLNVVCKKDELPFTRRILKYLVYTFFFSIARGASENFIRTYL